MKKYINNTAFDKMLKKERTRVCRRDWRDIDYFVFVAEHFMLAIPAALVDCLSNYAKSYLITPAGDRIKTGECVSHAIGGHMPAMVEFDPMPFLQEGTIDLKPTNYAKLYGNKQLAEIYSSENFNLLLPQEQLDILPGVRNGKTVGKNSVVIFEGENSIKLGVCPLHMKAECTDEVNSLITAINKNQIMLNKKENE